MQREYIGDGVYAEPDGFGGVVLVTSDGIRDTNTICLDPVVWAALTAWQLRHGAACTGNAP